MVAVPLEEQHHQPPCIPILWTTRIDVVLAAVLMESGG
jgi:hypothetical protein